jgi:hypothetical protein
MIPPKQAPGWGDHSSRCGRLLVVQNRRSAMAGMMSAHKREGERLRSNRVVPFHNRAWRHPHRQGGALDLDQLGRGPELLA